MFSKKVVFLLICFVHCIACNRQTTSTTSTHSLGKVTEIKWSEVVEFDTENLRIQFKKLKDNRCPSDVNCIIAGEGKVTLELSKGKEKAMMNLIAKGLCESEAGGCGQEKSALGYTIKLVNVYPYPQKEPIKEKEAYIKIVLTKGETKEETR